MYGIRDESNHDGGEGSYSTSRVDRDCNCVHSDGLQYNIIIMAQRRLRC